MEVFFKEMTFKYDFLFYIKSDLEWDLNQQNKK